MSSMGSEVISGRGTSFAQAGGWLLSSALDVSFFVGREDMPPAEQFSPHTRCKSASWRRTLNTGKRTMHTPQTRR